MQSPPPRRPPVVFNDRTRLISPELIAVPPVRTRRPCADQPFGSANYKLALLQWRVNAVPDYLIGKGIGNGRLKVDAKGETDPMMVCPHKKMG